MVFAPFNSQPSISAIRGPEIIRKDNESISKHYKFCAWSDSVRCDLNGAEPLCSSCATHMERTKSPDVWTRCVEVAAELY